MLLISTQTNYLNSSALSIEINALLQQKSLIALKKLYTSKVDIFNQFFANLSSLMNDINDVTYLYKRATLAKQSSQNHIQNIQNTLNNTQMDLAEKEKDGVFTSSVSQFKQLQLNFNSEKNKVIFLKNHNFPLIDTDDVKFFLCFENFSKKYSVFLKQVTTYLKLMPKSSKYICLPKTTKEEDLFLAFIDYVEEDKKDPFIDENLIRELEDINIILQDLIAEFQIFIHNI